MTDLELLEKYEPVLRFAKSERFFPMAVEPYVERCSLFASGPQGVLELFAHHNEPLITRIGKLKSEEFYLRFINKPLNDSDAWVWWAILSVVAVVGGWFLAGAVAVETVLYCFAHCRIDHFYACIPNPIANYSSRIGGTSIFCT